MSQLEYNITLNRLEVVKLEEFASISPPFIQTILDEGLTIKDEFIEEPTFVNRMELEPDGKLHAYAFFEDQYKNIVQMRYGIIAKGSIDIVNNSITFDSYDSQDPSYNTTGSYDVTKRKDTCVLLTSSSLNNVLNVGNGAVRGYVGTNGVATVLVEPAGSVGDNDYVDSGAPGIQTGHYRSDYFEDIFITGSRAGERIIPNSTFDTPTLPGDFSSTPTTPTGGTIDTIVYDYVLNVAGDYRLADLDGLTYVGAECRLHVTNDISIVGAHYIRIASGGKLELYMDGASANFAGQGIINEATIPNSLYYYGLAGNSTLAFATENVWYVSIIAPSVDVTFGGGGSDFAEFYGFIIANSVKLNGKLNFHFDEAISRV